MWYSMLCIYIEYLKSYYQAKISTVKRVPLTLMLKVWEVFLSVRETDKDLYKILWDL